MPYRAPKYIKKAEVEKQDRLGENYKDVAKD